MSTALRLCVLADIQFGGAFIMEGVKMKRLIHSSEDIFAMSNVLGKFVKVEKKLPFSFYYSPKNSSHGPRVKPVINPEKMRISDAGTLELCDKWEFTPGQNDSAVPKKIIDEMKSFFRKYLVLFLLVWEGLADDPILGYYLEGRLALADFIESLDFYEDYKEDLDAIQTVAELEEFCRKHQLVNFYGN